MNQISEHHETNNSMMKQTEEDIPRYSVLDRSQGDPMPRQNHHIQTTAPPANVWHARAYRAVAVAEPYAIYLILSMKYEKQGKERTQQCGTSRGGMQGGSVVSTH